MNWENFSTEMNEKKEEKHIPHYSNRTCSMINQVPNERESDDMKMKEDDIQFESTINETKERQEKLNSFIPQVIEYHHSSQKSEHSQDMFSHNDNENETIKEKKRKQKHQSKREEKEENDDMKPKLPFDKKEHQKEYEEEMTVEKELTMKNLRSFRFDQMTDEQTHSRIENWIHSNKADASLPHFGVNDD